MPPSESRGCGLLVRESPLSVGEASPRHGKRYRTAWSSLAGWQGKWRVTESHTLQAAPPSSARSAHGALPPGPAGLAGPRAAGRWFRPGPRAAGRGPATRPGQPLPSEAPSLPGGPVSRPAGPRQEAPARSCPGPAAAPSVPRVGPANPPPLPAGRCPSSVVQVRSVFPRSDGRAANTDALVRTRSYV